MGAVQASNPSQYFGVIQALSLVTRTNAVDIRTTGGSGPQLLAGSVVTWTYEVTNTGNSDLSALAVTDDRGVSIGSCHTCISEF